MSRPKPAADVLTVGDLFSGAGGFSEGFAQAGFKIKWAVENWPPAAATYLKNHPGTKVVERDILGLRTKDIAEELGPVNVIIGSPPCVHFSLANRGGNGDSSAGLRLVRKFLSIVRQLDPDYWVMENVPALRPHLEAEMKKDGTFDLFSGGIRIPVMKVMDVANFGVPQHRKRLFSGDFPIPIETHGPESNSRVSLVSLSSILTLGDPIPGRPPSPKTITDPNYPQLKVSQASLRDHFEDRRWRLSRYERQRAKWQKQKHPVYGRMSYPDQLNRPSRTITATRTGGARSTIIVKTTKRTFRTLTMREAATAQGFPLTYQFWAKSINDKDVLAGNAVPPPMARAIAEAILLDARYPVPAYPLIDMNPELPAPISIPFRRGHRFSSRRHFNKVVPIGEWCHEHRVMLDNQFEQQSKRTGKGIEARPEWKTRLYLGYAKKYQSFEIGTSTAFRLARTLLESGSTRVSPKDLRTILLSTVEWCTNGFPTGIALQERWTGRATEGVGPDEVVAWVARAVDRALPGPEWKDQAVPSEETDAVLSHVRRTYGEDAKDAGQPRDTSVRLLVSTIALSIACKCLNEGRESLGSLDLALKLGDDATLTFLAQHGVTPPPTSPSRNNARSPLLG